MRRAAFAVLSLAVLAGCAGGEAMAPAPAAASLGGASELVLTENPDLWRHDPHEVTAVRVDGDRLHVDVQYAGGCATHQFALLVSPVFMESYPVQMSGSLAHDANGDRCRALLGDRLVFDLGHIKDLYRRSYGVLSDTVHLNIRGWSERVVYSF
jgi:hypothetical protein